MTLFNASGKTMLNLIFENIELWQTNKLLHQAAILKDTISQAFLVSSANNGEIIATNGSLLKRTFSRHEKLMIVKSFSFFFIIVFVVFHKDIKVNNSAQTHEPRLQNNNDNTIDQQPKKNPVIIYRYTYENPP